MPDTNYIQGIFERSYDEKTVEETRTIQFIISTDAKDRHRSVLNMDNWKLDNFNNNPIVGYQHNVYGDNMCTPPNPDDVLGKSRAWLDTYRGKRALLSDVTFEPKDINETAEKVFRKVLFGSLRAASVGFLEVGKGKTEYIRDEEGNVKDQTYFYGGQELIEWSVVNIPSNPEALQRSMRNHTLAALNFVQRLMEDYSIKDIRQMRVQEILDTLEKRYTTPPLSEIEKELVGADPNLNKYQARLIKIKNEAKS